MQLVIVINALLGFMATIIYAHGSINFKVGVTAPYIHLSQRSSFNAWKNKIPRTTLGTSDLDDVGLVSIKTNNNKTTNKDIFEWIQSLVDMNPITTTMEPTSPSPEECQQCKCGEANKPNRIVGGHESEAHQYPWIVLLKYRSRFYCGGTIICDRYIVTAAHCVKGFRKEDIRIVVGVHSRNSSTHPDGGEFKVERTMVHPRYTPSQFNNDIALIKIAGTINFNGTIRPVCLAERDNTFSGESGIVAGWGALSEGGPVSNTLQAVTVPILSNNQCRASKYPDRKITENMICAGYVEGGKDSCQGDSGGPLHVISENCHKLIGVVSWGEGCGIAGYPGVYTRFNRYISWIEHNTKDSCYCESSFCLS